MVHFVEYLYYVRLFLFWCWTCKSNLISGCFCWRFCGIYALLENAFWLAAKKTYQFLFWLSYYKVDWTKKCFFVVSFLWLNLENLDHDNSAFLCICSLRGTIHIMAQLLRKLLEMIIKMITVFLLTLEVVLKWMGGGQKLHLYDLFHHYVFFKDSRNHLLSLT